MNRIVANEARFSDDGDVGDHGDSGDLGQASAVTSGNFSLHLESALLSRSSTSASSAFLAMANSVTSRYRARSSIFFSRKESGFSLARSSRLLSTTATSSREPVRILSEFSLKRNFQSWWLSHLTSIRKLRILVTSPFFTTGRRPTVPTLLKGTSTRRLLALILSK